MRYDLWWTTILDYRLHVLVDCWKENSDDECKYQGFVGNLLDDLSICDVWHGSCISLSPKRHRAHAESIHCFITVVGSFLESPACNAPKNQAKNDQGPHMRFSVQPTICYPQLGIRGPLSELPHKGDSTYQAIKGPMDRSPISPQIAEWPSRQAIEMNQARPLSKTTISDNSAIPARFLIYPHRRDSGKWWTPNDKI